MSAFSRASAASVKVTLAPFCSRPGKLSICAFH